MFGQIKLAATLRERHEYKLLIAGAFLIPLKLSIAYVALVPILLLWLASGGKKIKCEFGTPERVIFFVSVLALVSLFGRDVGGSFSKIPSILFFSFFPFVIRDICSEKGVGKPLAAFILGQSIASINTMLASIPGSPIPRIFLGHISESGQLAMSVVVVWGCIIASGGLESFRGGVFEKRAHLLVAAILMTISLLANLKRGPWVGVFAAGLALSAVYRKRLIFPLLLCAILIGFLVGPIRDRLLNVPADFLVAGGRKEMWAVGIEMAKWFPLGLGFENSHYMREFALHVPPELTHLHNNYLTLLFEGGWIVLALYLWIIVSALVSAVRISKPLSLAIGGAILSNQVAGLVEYNFGDSKVYIAFLFYLGLLSALEVQGQKSA